ncbi:MAG: phosphoribosyltransferase family protein [Candidatus Saccharibacteria bacterium]|nr:phosphoribosyltransferase family protein [Candidatus Saccharibacteria bacterium]
MYFESRGQAGEKLAEELFEKYRYENSVILAVNLGGVLVGKPISQKIHCPISLLLSEQIDIPGQNLQIGSVSQTGNFTYNDNLSSFEINEYKNEFYGYFEEQKRQAFHRINRMVGDGGMCDRKLLNGRNVIIISDGFDDQTLLGAVMDFIKPVRIERLIAAAPVASIGAVNRLHALVDELHVLDVKRNYFGANHYFDDNNLPSQAEIIEQINQNILSWQ